jgi:hypothetical protein
LFWPGSSLSGTKASISGFHFTLPRDCENRCTVGCQPAELSTMSHEIERPSLVTLLPSLVRRRTSTSFTANLPLTRVTA